MTHFYATRARVTLLVLMLLAIMTGCSGPKPDADTQSGFIEPTDPEPIATDTPTPTPTPTSTPTPTPPTTLNPFPFPGDTQTFNDFKTKVKTCVDELLDDNTVLSLLFSKFYQGNSSGYGSWFNDNVNYGDLMDFWPLGRGAEAAKEQLCQGGIKQSLGALAGLAGGGRFNPADISNFIGDMGLAVSNQGRLGNVYGRIGKILAKPMGQGWWNLGQSTSGSSGSAGGLYGNLVTHVSSSNGSILGKWRERRNSRHFVAEGEDVVKVGPGKGDHNLPLPQGILRQVRAVMATVRDEEGITQELHESAQSALTKRNFAH